MKRSKEGLRDLWDTIKQINICQKVKKRERADNLFKEIMVENFPNLMKEMVYKFQKLKRTLTRINLEACTKTHYDQVKTESRKKAREK